MCNLSVFDFAFPFLLLRKLKGPWHLLSRVVKERDSVAPPDRARALTYLTPNQLQLSLAASQQVLKAQHGTPNTQRSSPRPICESFKHFTSLDGYPPLELQNLILAQVRTLVARAVYSCCSAHTVFTLSCAGWLRSPADGPRLWPAPWIDADENTQDLLSSCMEIRDAIVNETGVSLSTATRLIDDAEKLAAGVGALREATKISKLKKRLEEAVQDLMGAKRVLKWSLDCRLQEIASKRADLDEDERVAQQAFESGAESALQRILDNM